MVFSKAFSSLFGSSKDWYNSARDNLSNAKNNVIRSGKDLASIASIISGKEISEESKQDIPTSKEIVLNPANITDKAQEELNKGYLSSAYDSVAKTTAMTAKAATTAAAVYNAHSNYSHCAGKVVSLNADLHAANYLTNAYDYLTGNNTASWATTAAAAVTQKAAETIVNYPVASMVGGMVVAGAISIMATHPKETFEIVKAVGSSAYNFIKAGANLVTAAADAAIGYGLETVESKLKDFDSYFEKNLISAAQETDNTDSTNIELSGKDPGDFEINALTEAS